LPLIKFLTKLKVTVKMFLEMFGIE